MDEQLDDECELLFRQIPSEELRQAGEPSSEAFKPKRKDNGHLSLDRSKCISVEQSFNNFRNRGFRSEAVFGLTVGEFLFEQILCWHSPEYENPAHAHADYTNLTNNKRNKAAKRLKEKALRRGKLYPPT